MPVTAVSAKEGRYNTKAIRATMKMMNKAEAMSRVVALKRRSRYS